MGVDCDANFSFSDEKHIVAGIEIVNDLLPRFKALPRTASTNPFHGSRFEAREYCNASQSVPRGYGMRLHHGRAWRWAKVVTQNAPELNPFS
jgi:hypothetical protein